MNNFKIIIYVQSSLHRFCIFAEMYTKYQCEQVSFGLSATAKQHTLLQPSFYEEYS